MQGATTIFLTTCPVGQASSKTICPNKKIYLPKYFTNVPRACIFMFYNLSMCRAIEYIFGYCRGAVVSKFCNKRLHFN